VRSRAARFWALTLGLLSIAAGLALIGAYVVLVHRGPGAAAAAAGGPPEPRPAPRIASAFPVLSVASPSASVRAALANGLSNRGMTVALGVLDRATGTGVLYHEEITFQTASIVKVDILATMLWQVAAKKAALTDDQEDLAERMITASDNDAASRMWDLIGQGRGLTAANQAFGLRHTQPGPGPAWGSTRTTVADQLQLLNVVTSPSSPLPGQSREFILDLMSRVRTDQRWGVPAAAGRGATGVFVKNGWDTRTSDADFWVANSIGRIVEPGHDWLVVVLSNQNLSVDRGRVVVEKAATLALQGLRAG